MCWNAGVLAICMMAGATAAASQPEPRKPGMMLVGSAEVVDGRVRLTRSLPQTTGAAWFTDRRYVADGFEMVFDFQITDPGGLGPGADGLAIVLQSQGPEALAGRGSAGGFALGDGWGDLSWPGIPRSIAVLFDTYRNHDGYDPSDNYVAICTNGPISKMRWPPRRPGISRKLPIRLKDGRVHRARVRYKPPMMTVYLDDGEPVWSMHQATPGWDSRHPRETAMRIMTSLAGPSRRPGPTSPRKSRLSIRASRTCLRTVWKIVTCAHLVHVPIDVRTVLSQRCGRNQTVGITSSCPHTSDGR